MEFIICKELDDLICNNCIYFRDSFCYALPVGVEITNPYVHFCGEGQWYCAYWENDPSYSPRHYQVLLYGDFITFKLREQRYNEYYKSQREYKYKAEDERDKEWKISTKEKYNRLRNKVDDLKEEIQVLKQLIPL